MLYIHYFLQSKNTIIFRVFYGLRTSKNWSKSIYIALIQHITKHNTWLFASYSFNHEKATQPQKAVRPKFHTYEMNIYRFVWIYQIYKLWLTKKRRRIRSVVDFINITINCNHVKPINVQNFMYSFRALGSSLL